MKYKLFEKTIGTNKVIELKYFETECEINNFNYIPNIGFIYSSGNLLGKISDTNEFPWIGNENGKRRSGSNPIFNYISGLDCDIENNCIIIAEDGGRFFSKVDLLDGYTYDIGYGQDSHVIKKDLKKFSNNCNAWISTKSSDSFYILTESRKIYFFDGNEFKHFSGNGTSLSSIGDNAFSCGLGNPKHLCYREQKLYFIDNSTSYIKEIEKEKIRNFLKVDNVNPLNIKVNKNNLYILGEKSIWNYSFSSNRVGGSPIYLSENNIKDISFSDNKIYILEEYNEQK